MTIEIEFMEAINGTQKQVTYSRSNRCDTCYGKRIKPGTKELECTNCEGTGYIAEQFGSQTVQQECDVCNGAGKNIQNCLTCNGTGSLYQHAKESITIPKGVDNGVNLRMAKKGNFSSKGENGDLLIKVDVKPHPYFRREGADIYTDKFITMT